MKDFYEKYGIKRPTKTIEEICREFAKDLLPVLERDYDNPEIRADFEKWLEEKKKKEKKQF